MNHEGLGKVLFFSGLFIALTGAIVWWFGGKLGSLGRLPGDIVIERENFRFYFPLTTLLLINGAIWIFFKIYNALQR